MKKPKCETKRRYAVTVLVDVRATTAEGFRKAEKRLRELRFSGFCVGENFRGHSVTHDRKALKRVAVREVKP